jgi:hypothetical protein
VAVLVGLAGAGQAEHQHQTHQDARRERVGTVEQDGSPGSDCAEGSKGTSASGARQTDGAGGLHGMDRTSAKFRLKRCNVQNMQEL